MDVKTGSGAFMPTYESAIDLAQSKLQSVLDNGQAAEKFGEMVSALGGPTDFVEKSEIYLPSAKIMRPVYATQEGFVSAMNTKEIGMAVVKMGGGRMKSSDSIDYAVGFNNFISLGEKVDINTPLAMIHAQNEQQWLESEKIIQQVMSYAECKPKDEIQIYQHIRSN